MKFKFNSDSHKTLEPASVKIQHSDADTPAIISRHLRSIFNQLPSYQPIVIICVGTDRSTGDSLGPLVGSQLSKHGLHGFHLYGTLDNPVHAMNLSDVIHEIQQQFHDPFILAIDACLGQVSSVGCIHIGHGPLKPGAGVNKELPPVGDVHITGIVNVGGFMEYFVLQNTRLSLVMSMAEVIADAIHSAIPAALKGFPKPVTSALPLD